MHCGGGGWALRWEWIWHGDTRTGENEVVRPSEEILRFWGNPGTANKLEMLWVLKGTGMIYLEKIYMSELGRYFWKSGIAFFFFFISIPSFPPTHFNSIELPGSSPCSHLPVHLLCRWQHQVRQQGQGKRDGQGSQRHTPQAGGDWWRSRVTHQLGDAQYLNCGGGRRSPSTANTQSEEHLVNIHACACSYPHQSFTLNHFPGHLHKSENKITAVWSNIRPFFSLFQEALWKITYLICFLWQDI